MRILQTSVRLLAMLMLAMFPFSVTHGAMVLQAYNANSHDRFQNNAAFIGNPYDWSGVGRGTADQWATMISPSYFLSANHFHPAASATVRFHYNNNPSGTFEDRTVLSGVQIGTSDLWLGRLSAPVSSNVEIYPILALPTVAAYENRTIYTFGLTDGTRTPTTQRLGRNQIDPGTIALYNTVAPPAMPVYNAAYKFDYDNPGGLGADESFLQSGDSGGPSFNLAAGSIPALIGIHWATDNDPVLSSLDTFVPAYINAIQSAMIGESLTLIPEPASATLLALGGMAAFGIARRIRRFAA